MGRPRTPTALKVVKGTAQACRMNKNEPKPPPGLPSCPPHLSDEAKAEWRRITPKLKEMRLLSHVDRAALAGYCELWARWQKAEKMIQESGEVITTPNGSLQVSPWISIAHRSLVELRKFASEFGLSPASRSKVSTLPEPEKDNEFSRFFD